MMHGTHSDLVRLQQQLQPEAARDACSHANALPRRSRRHRSQSRPLQLCWSLGGLDMQQRWLASARQTAHSCSVPAVPRCESVAHRWRVRQAPEGVGNAVMTTPATREYQVLVETAMFSACGGLAFALSSLLKLSSYEAFLMPLPVLLCALRNGGSAGRKAVRSTVILLAVLFGPLQAVSYLLNHGILSAALCTFWSRQAPVLLMIPMCAALRVLGQAGSIVVSSWALQENIFALIVNNLYSLLDQFAAAVGTAQPPDTGVLMVIAGTMLYVNANLYMLMLTLIYTFLFKSLGLRTPTFPRWLQKRFPLPVGTG